MHLHTWGGRGSVESKRKERRGEEREEKQGREWVGREEKGDSDIENTSFHFRDMALSLNIDLPFPAPALNLLSLRSLFKTNHNLFKLIKFFFHLKRSLESPRNAFQFVTFLKSSGFNFVLFPTCFSARGDLCLTQKRMFYTCGSQMFQ